jgi:histidine ammonia-lyase/phenylalanine ammonia-lyase
MTAEAMKMCNPATIHSRSTECHNQDKVSMGTLAARDALRVAELTERVAAIALLAVCQAADVRGPATCRARTRAVLEAVRASVPTNTADRRQDVDIEGIVERLRRDDLAVGSAEEP